MVNAPSTPQHPWPHALPDQPVPLLSFYAHHLSLYSDLRAFTEQRVQLEREYGTKLKAMVGKLREKELKERKVVLLTVGEESSKGWEEGLEKRSTLLTSLSTHLTTLETISGEHLRLADSLQAQIIDELRKSGEKKESGRKKVGGWVEGLVEERERSEGEVGKAMTKYHQACLDLDQARTKHSRAPRDDKHLPRLLKSYRTALVAKNNARNTYVLALGVGNREKEVFYDRTERGLHEAAEALGQDDEEERRTTPFGPGIARCQAELQTLFHSSALRLNSLLSHTSMVYSHFYTAQANYASSIVQAHTLVDPAKDSDLYAEYNARPINHQAPQKSVFEPCPGFLEEGTITLGGRDELGFDEPGGKAGLGPSPVDGNGNPGRGEEVVVLQNRLATAREGRMRLEGLVKGWKGEVRRGREVVTTYEENRGLGDPDEIVEAMMITLKDLSLAQLKMEAMDVEIGLLEEALGNDQGAQKPHDFKSASFAIPTPCEYCKSSIWGITKPGSTCRRCGSNVHVKCANKVPAECTGGSSSSIPNRRISYMFPRKESSTSQSISDIASIASTKDRDKEESSLRAIRRSFTSRLHSSDSFSSPAPGLSPLALATPVLPPPHRMTDMDNLDTTGIVGMGNGSRLHSSTSQPVLTSPIQRETGTGRRISMFGSPAGGPVSPGGTPARRGSGDILGRARASPGGSPVIEEEVGGLEPAFRLNGLRSTDPSPSATPGGLAGAKVLFDFEAADDDELTVEKGVLVYILEPDDGQGWTKVRMDVHGGSLEGLIPAGYVEHLQSGSNTPQYRPQANNYVSPVVSPATQPVMQHASPISSPARHVASPGFPFNPPTMPGSYSPASPPAPPMQTRPSVPIHGTFGQVTALYDYVAAESDEFALKKGMTYNLSRRGTAYDAGWWELSYDDGRTGIAPSNYLRRI